MVEEEEEYEYKEEVEPENTVATEEGEGEYKETANDKENDIAANENAKRDEVVQGEEKRKRVPRGPTQMASLGITEDKTKKPDKATVIFNSKDQPIGDPSVQLASVLGVLVRRNSPLTFKDWRVIPKEAKNNVWKIFQMRFIVNDFYKDYYYGKMGCYLKEARSRKVGKILVIDELEEEEREKRIKELKPQNMSDNEWEDFVETVCSEEFRAKRLKMQEIRQKHTTPHTISREGYARLEEKMQKERKTTEEIDRVELWITGHKQKEGKEPNPGDKIARAEADTGAGADVGGSSVTDDLLVKALGDDKPGRLKGIGFGATKTKMVVNSYYKKIINECRKSMKEMNGRLMMLEERSSRCVCCHDGSLLQKASPNSGNASNNHDSANIVRENGSPLSRANVVPQPVGVPENNRACRLLSWYTEGEIVADAVIAETDPKKLIRGMPIGFGAYKVSVIASRVDDALLYRKTNELKCIHDAIGTYISWAKDLILLD